MAKITCFFVCALMLGCSTVAVSEDGEASRVGVVPFGGSDTGSSWVSDKLFSALEDLFDDASDYEFISKGDLEDAFESIGFDPDDFEYGVPPDMVVSAGQALDADLIVYGFVSPVGGDQFMISWNISVISSGNTVVPDAVTVLKNTSAVNEAASGMMQSIASEVGQRAQDALYLAEYYESVANWPMAISFYRQAIGLDPGLLEARLSLADIYLSSDVDSVGRAEEIYQAILAEDATNSQALGGTGRVCLAREDYEGALSCFESAVEADPDNASAYLYMAEAYRELGRLEEAVGSFESALAQNPGNLQARYALALLYFEMENYEAAIPHIEQVLESRPDFTNLRLKLVASYEAVRRYSDAADNAIIVLESRPDDSDLILFVASMEARSGRTSDAVNRLEGLISSTGLRQAYVLLATVYRDSGQRGAMQNVFSRLKDAYPGDPVANYMMGAFYYQSGTEHARGGELVMENVPVWEQAVSELQAAISYLSQVTGYRADDAQRMIAAATNSITLAEEKIDRVLRYQN
ncbi:tetratricopeptide repeat protein [Candidatus Fermentibacterales bacterium]|nr:tetratricopeptide repeat protein [Candidatus Fermentibacterales bacterium]